VDDIRDKVAVLKQFKNFSPEIVSITQTVRKQIARFFRPPNAEEVISALEGATLPLVANNAERVHLAILLLSRGDIA